MESERDKRSLHSQNWSSLPEELISAILVRLPVKYLLQLKCVSKDWLRLISSSHFVKAHLHVSAKEYKLLLYSPVELLCKHYSVTSLFDDHNPFYLDIPVDNTYKYSHIVGSVNGLICFHNGSRKGFVLWNPSTRKLKKVPAPTKPCGFVYGFGYDEVYDDYKLVGIDAVLRSTPLCATIYSLRSDSWRELDFQGSVARCESAKLVNGKLHWVTGSDDWGIISFDLVDEKFGEVVQPSYKEEIKYLSLGGLGSDLCMLCIYMTSIEDVTRSDVCVVWVMKEYGVKASWTKLYTFPDNWMHFVDSPPICMSSKGASLFFNGTTLLSIYNPEDKTFKAVAEVCGRPHRADLYIESLVCPFLQNDPMQQH